MITNYFDKQKTYFVHYFNTPLGEMTAAAEDDALVYLRFGHQGIYGSKLEKNEILDRTVEQLEEYFRGERKEFDIPIRVKAKEFQNKALEEIRKVRYGETSTYGDIALKLGKKTYARGVGATCRGNSIVIIIPCHRIVMLKEDGYYNYSDGNDVKKSLLELEEKYSK